MKSIWSWRVQVALIPALGGILGATSLCAQNPDLSPTRPTVQSQAETQITAIGKTAEHSVTLTWKASMPASPAAADVIVGYIVYRSEKSHASDATPINELQVKETTFIDRQVEPGKTYYYVTRAVSARGVVSGPSNEVQVQIPQ